MVADTTYRPKPTDRALSSARLQFIAGLDAGGQAFGPRQLLEQLVANGPHPPANPREFALLLMATHRAYLLDTFGAGHDSPERRTNATAALTALWERLLAE